MTPFDKRHIKVILSGAGNGWTHKFLRLILTAPLEDKLKLRKVFPEEVDAVSNLHGFTPMNLSVSEFQDFERAEASHKKKFKKVSFRY